MCTNRPTDGTDTLLTQAMLHVAPTLGLSTAGSGALVHVHDESLVLQCSLPMSPSLVATVQVILELVFGFEEGRLSPELVDHYTNTFIVLAEHLFSYPINFPGFGAVLLDILSMKTERVMS